MNRTPHSDGPLTGSGKAPQTIRRDLLLIAAMVLFLLVPFLDKAYHIDDTLFLIAAKHIVKEPLNFYGFETNWYGFSQDMSAINQNPPLTSYFIALVSLIGGWSEPVLHGAFLIPSLFFGVGTYFLARFFCHKPLFAALIAVLTPAFVVSASNVMSDVFMCAFYVWSLYLWIMGIETKKQFPLVLSTGSICLGFLAKYFAATAIPLLILYTVARERKLSLQLAWLLLPILLMLGYEWWTQSLYGHGLLSDAVLYSGAHNKTGWAQLFDKTLTGLSFTGGCVAISLFISPFLWRGKMFWVAALALFVGIYAVLLLKGSVGSLVFHTGSTIDWSKLLQMSLWVTVGIHVLFIGVINVRRHRDIPSVLLFAWTLGTFVFSTFLNWTVNGRTLMPMVPAVAIQHVRLLNRKDISDEEREAQHILSVAEICMSIIPAVLLAFAVGAADASLANAQRKVARTIQSELRIPKRNVWFEGHWGFQYYMEKIGATAIDFNASRIQPGDVLILPVNNTNIQKPGFPFRLVKKYVLSPFQWLTTMGLPPVGAGFYADVWGPLPYSFGKVPDEEYLVFSFASPPTTDSVK